LGDGGKGRVVNWSARFGCLLDVGEFLSNDWRADSGVCYVRKCPTERPRGGEISMVSAD